MPVEAFEVIVGVSGGAVDSDNQAVAEASRYLAYSDQTDTFGYAARVIDVDVYDGTDVLDYGIGLSFTAPMPSDDDLKAFMDEMAMLAKVESVERIAYEVA